MNEVEAKKVRKDLEKYCVDRGLWVEVRESRKPKLKDIVLTISVRITEK